MMENKTMYLPLHFLGRHTLQESLAGYAATAWVVPEPSGNGGECY